MRSQHRPPTSRAPATPSAAGAPRAAPRSERPGWRPLMAADGDQTRRFLGALHGSAPPGSLVELRFRLGPGMGQRFLLAERLGQVADRIASLAGSTDVFVGVITRARRGGSRRDLVQRAAVVWVDCDDRTAVAALARFRPRPSVVVASGSGPNQHAYWLLDEPVGIEDIERVNHRLALALGADLHCGDGARIMRPAGSINRKHSPPTAVRLLACDEHARVALADLTARLAPDPPPTNREIPVRDQNAAGCRLATTRRS